MVLIGNVIESMFMTAGNWNLGYCYLISIGDYYYVEYVVDETCGQRPCSGKEIVR